MRWRRGQALFRVHASDYGATEFNPGSGHGRFHPFVDIAGHGVPTLYGAVSVDGALSETVFHDIPIDHRHIRRIFRQRLKTLLLSAIAPTRSLKLIDLRGHGLSALRLHRSQLIDTSVMAYPETVRWAQALHRTTVTPDGLIWRSRQFDTADVVVLFGDRVARTDLRVVSAPRPLYTGPGFRLVKEAARLVRIAIID